MHDLIRVYITDKWILGADFSIWLWAALSVIALALFLIRRTRRPSLRLVKVNIDLGNVGSVELQPNWEDVEIAHKIWAELVTRKAAVPIDPEQDVIIEVYDSWYALFQRIRQLLSDIPGSCLKQDSTHKLISIAVDTLNLGLRPHLTKWQAQLRNWWKQTEKELDTQTPQEHQKQFPKYDEMVRELLAVNCELVHPEERFGRVALSPRTIHHRPTMCRYP